MKINKIYPVILSGGSGTRLWPQSRLSFPKQFLKINSDYTLIQETLIRIKNNKIFHSPILICNDEHRFLIAEQLRELGIKPKLIILEPIGKNTAAAVTVASLIVKKMVAQLRNFQKIDFLTPKIDFFDFHPYPNP